MAIWLRQPTGDSSLIAKALSRGESVRWVAAGHTTTKEALADPDFPITFNALHPDFGAASLMRCDNIRVVATGFKVMSVDANFSIPTNGSEHEPPEQGQTNPLVYSWATVQETVQIDRDLNGNAILSGAHRAVTGLTQPRNYKRLTITRWQSSYNNSQAQGYENHVNSDTFEGAAATTVKCSVINPSTSYEQNATLIPVDHTFDFKTVSIWGEHPWQTVFVNQDSVAYATISEATKQVRIVDANGDFVNNALLDAEGKPLDTTLTYIIENPDYEPNNGKPRLIPNATPSWVAKARPTGADQVSGTGSAVMLRYMTVPPIAFSGLGF